MYFQSFFYFMKYFSLSLCFTFKHELFTTTVGLSNRELFIEIGLYDKILVPRNVMTFVCLLIRQKNFLTPSVGQECVVGFKFNFFYNQARIFSGHTRLNNYNRTSQWVFILFCSPIFRMSINSKRLFFVIKIVWPMILVSSDFFPIKS